MDTKPDIKGDGETAPVYRKTRACLPIRKGSLVHITEYGWAFAVPAFLDRGTSKIFCGIENLLVHGVATHDADINDDVTIIVKGTFDLNFTFIGDAPHPR